MRTSSPRSSARSRTRRRSSTRQGCSPTRTAFSPCRTARTCSPARRRSNLNSAQHLSVRYGRNTNSQPYGAAPQQHVRQLGRQHEQVQLDQPQPQHGDQRRSKLNEFIFQYADFAQPHRVAQPRAERDVPRTACTIGANGNTPQTTEQKKLPVPRRLLVARHRQRRHRPRLQGGRELHQRAAPVHHLQHRQGRDAATRT